MLPEDPERAMILALNAGSSSVKFAVFDEVPPLPWIAKGSLSGFHRSPHATKDSRAAAPVPGLTHAGSPDEARLRIAFADGTPAIDERAGESTMGIETAVRRVFTALRAASILDRVTAVGHRIVHGGRSFIDPVELDEPTLEALRGLVPLDPLHQPLGIAVVESAVRARPDVPQIGCFDTAFHASRPRLARLYGLPRALADEGVVSYGFHGLSYAHIASVLRHRYEADAGGRVIAAHLGSGVSLCALLDGRSVATTMGFSVLDGPPMSTRSGSLDPGIILHLIQERGLSVEAVSDLLYHRSGWLGLSGISDDMSTLLRSDDERAREAVALFVYRVGREIGSLAAALGGLDRLVFTGGIGEHAAAIRAGICERAAWLGVDLDSARNEAPRTALPDVVSASGSAVEVLVIPADEERVIAESVRAWRASSAVRPSSRERPR